MRTGHAGVIVSAADTVNRATAFLTDRGTPPALAAVQAHHLVEAELRGHPSHGLRRLGVLRARIDSGRIHPAAEPDLRWTAAAGLRVDGRNGLGPVTAHRAIDELLARLPETGVAVASLHRTHHLGMLAPYVERISAAGGVGLVLSSTEGLVHPWGGAGALIGTNPVAIGVPAAGGDLTLDMSTGAVSAGKILDHRARGLPLPAGWAVDRTGTPTTDAAAAADGAISPFGGPKGYALGVAIGAMVAAVTGTALGPDVHGTLDPDLPTTKGDVMIALDPSVLSGVDMRSAVGTYFALIRDSGAAAGIPGDRARAERARRERDGIELPADVWELLSPFGSDTREATR